MYLFSIAFVPGPEQQQIALWNNAREMLAAYYQKIAAAQTEGDKEVYRLSAEKLSVYCDSLMDTVMGARDAGPRIVRGDPDIAQEDLAAADFTNSGGGRQLQLEANGADTYWNA
eukprot:GHVU01202102.1.p1 GENE.GHVU01202102.1~~GHVU01202102.1.p1  ORF type:complete len:114 (+),score=19.96 GHVU01202102.1:19-360(+)